MKLKKKNALVHALLPYAIRPVWLWVRVIRAIKRSIGVRAKNRKVLLVCQNCVAADHLRPIMDCLREDQRLSLYATNDHFPSQEINKWQIKRALPVAYRNILFALFCDWDLILYVNHPWGFGSWFPPFLKKAYINHGLYSGKINNQHGEDGLYGRSRTTRAHRGLLYDRMFAASGSERAAAIAADAVLSEVVVVTGSLIVDELRERAASREQIRAQLGLRTSDRVVHIVSTWGPASLVATLGDALLDAAASLGLPYRFLVSLHPRFDKFAGGGRTREDILKQWSARGFEVDVDNEKWKQFLLASDVAVADNSSLALYHFVFGTPVIFVPVEDSAFVSGTPFDLLSRSSLRLLAVADLESLLSTAMASHAEPRTSVAANYLVEHIGSARSRHLQEIEILLYN